MRVTLWKLEFLLNNGWSIRGVNGRIEFRDRQGISGSDFQCAELDFFPDAVEHWLRLNITPGKHFD